MLFPGRRSGPPLPLLWRLFLINAAMLTVATLALAFSPATVSFPIALTESLVLGGGLAATLGLDLLVLRRALGSALGSTGLAVEPGAPGRPAPAQTRLAPERHQAANHEVGTRLLVGWSRPHHLSEEDAEAWAAAELTRVLAVAGTDRARLTRLRSASQRYSRPLDWLLELDVAPDQEARHCVESPAWSELLGDFRLLGMRPATMVADGDRVLGEGAG